MKTILTKKNVCITLVVILASFLRFWNIENVPPSPSLDEASISYNAYSILETGGDEYGEFPILSHRSYDDWRRAIYLYLTLPFVKVFGLQVVSVRLPAVILSVLTVLAFFYIVLDFFLKRSSFSFIVALFASLLLAVNPWHIYISRLGHESNAYLSFSVFGVLFFLKGERNKKWSMLFLSLFFFVVSMASYYAGQVFIPLFLTGIVLIFRRSLLAFITSNKKMLIGLLICLGLLIPLFSQLFSPTALVRFQGTSTFKPEAHWEMFQKRVELRNNAVENNDIFRRLFYSSHIFPLQVLIDGYVSHFNPQWLFFNSSAEPHKVPNMGLLYIWGIPFIVIGIIVLLLSHRIEFRVKKFIFLWFFLAPLPAAIATQAPHAMRSYIFLLNWQIFIAFGLTYIFFGFKKFKYVILSVFILLILFSLSSMYKNYFDIFPREQSNSFHYALSKTIPYVLLEQQHYKKVIFSNKGDLYQSYMLFLYHSRYDPLRYQKFGGTKSGGYAETHVFDKYEFRDINLKNERMQDGVLYIVNISEGLTNGTELKTFKNLDGKDAIRVYGSK